MLLSRLSRSVSRGFRGASVNQRSRSFGSAPASSARMNSKLRYTLVGGVFACGTAFLAVEGISSAEAKQNEVPQLTPSTRSLSALEDSKYASPDEVKKAVEEIREIVGENGIQLTKDILDQHSDSGWQSRHAKESEHPAAVVLPSSTEDVSKILKIANRYRVPVTAYSGGTSLEGNFIPVYGGISLDMSNFDKIVEIHPDDMDVVVQSNVGWEDLNAALKPYGLKGGADAGPGATIGGMVNTGASGINAFFYGPMRHNVVNLTAVLADGTIVKTKRRAKKSSAGYNLSELFVNSEGTLGIVTEVTLKLHPIPKFTRVGLLTFAKLSQATETVQEMIKAGVSVDAIELLDDEQMKIINKAEITDRKWDEHATLILRFAGATQSIIDINVDKLRAISKNYKPLTFEFSQNEDESDELWEARKTALWSVVGAYADKAVWTTDVAVPISNLSKIMTDSKGYAEESGLPSAVVGHVGDGNFHLFLAYDPVKEKDAAEAAVQKLVMRAIELEGTSTGEHGIGVGKRHYLVEELGEDTIALERQIKHALDPNAILNPGKVFQTSKDDVSDHA